MGFVLIPVADASPTVQDYLMGTDDQGPQTSQELAKLVCVAVKFTLTSNLLLAYVRALTGRPCEN